MNLWPLCGVLQDLVLSPLLFNIYMKLLGEIIHPPGVRYHQCDGDDAQLYPSACRETSHAVDVVSWCLEVVRV